MRRARLVTSFRTPSGSTLALTDPAGAVQTQYTYTPFGTATASGPTYTNPFKFTGREDDGTGLYYSYRARYYHPGLGRWNVGPGGEEPTMNYPALLAQLRQARYPRWITFEYEAAEPEATGLPRAFAYLRRLVESAEGGG